MTKARTVTPYEKTGSFTDMPYSEFESGAFGVAAGSSNHYTAWWEMINVRFATLNPIECFKDTK